MIFPHPTPANVQCFGDRPLGRSTHMGDMGLQKGKDPRLGTKRFLSCVRKKRGEARSNKPPCSTGMSGKGGVARELFSTTYLLWYVSAFQLGVTIVYFAYFPWTRKILFTYFASPATYGVLTSERFVSLQWWVYSLTALVIFPLWWVGWMNNHYLSKWPKTTWIAFCSVELALWVATWAIETWWLIDRNNPSFPDNPANSYKACCTPEFYNTVGACPNFGDPHPECTPGININELGTNGDMVFFYAITVVMVVVFILYIVLSVQIMRLTDLFIQVPSPLSCPVCLVLTSLSAQSGDPEFQLVPMNFPNAGNTGPSGGSTAVLQPSVSLPSAVFSGDGGTGTTTAAATATSRLMSSYTARHVLKERK